MAPKNKKLIGKEKTRLALLDAAKALFERKGFETAGTDEIARRAGVSKGTVYFYFSSKEALFLAVVKRELDRIRDLAHNSVSASAGATEALLSTTSLMLSGQWPLRELAQVVQSLWVHARGELRRKLSLLLKQIYRDHRKVAGRLLDEAKLPPHLRGADHEVLAYLLLGCVEGLWRQAMLEGDEFPLEKVVEALGVVFLGRRR